MFVEFLYCNYEYKWLCVSIGFKKKYFFKIKYSEDIKKIEKFEKNIEYEQEKIHKQCRNYLTIFCFNV